MYKDFAKYGRLLFEQGLNNSHSGNMSMRKDSSIYITRHGAQLCCLTPQNFVKVNLHDTKKDAPASVEVKVHRAVYLSCPGIQAIAHAHTPHGIVLSLNEGSITPIDEEGSYYLKEIPVLKCRKTIASDEVASKLPELLDKYKVAIVAGHGAFAGAKTIEEASMLLGVTESVCRIVYLNKLLRSKK